MIILPAIDIKDQKVVRLSQGKFDQMQVYGDDPVAVAKGFEATGAQYLHVVDLDGAKDGISGNSQVINDIISAVSIPVEIGGGIRTFERAEALVAMGADRIILGTVAVTDKDLTSQIAAAFPGKVAVSVDAVGGKASIKGWVCQSDVDVLDICAFMEEVGIGTLIYTDIQKDGMLCGPSFEDYIRIQKATKLNIIASGGVTTLEDVQKLKAMDVYGCIIGKAIYDGKIDLKEVLAC